MAVAGYQELMQQIAARCLAISGVTRFTIDIENSPPDLMVCVVARGLKVAKCVTLGTLQGATGDDLAQMIAGDLKRVLERGTARKT